jgi:hypothetical protein
MGLLLSFGHKVVAQRRNGTGQMSLDRAGRNAEHLRGAGGIQVQEQPQGDDLPLPGRKPHQGRHDRGINGAIGGGPGRSRARDHPRVWHRDLPAAPAPPGDVRVQRGTDHPRRRCRMPADGAPRSKGPGEGLVNKILRRVPVTDADQDSAEAIICGSSVEFREVQALGSHTHVTHHRRAGTTWLVSAAPRSVCPVLRSALAVFPGASASPGHTAASKALPASHPIAARPLTQRPLPRDSAPAKKTGADQESGRMRPASGALSVPVACRSGGFAAGWHVTGRGSRNVTSSSLCGVGDPGAAAAIEWQIMNG